MVPAATGAEATGAEAAAAEATEAKVTGEAPMEAANLVAYRKYYLACLASLPICVNIAFDQRKYESRQ